MNAYNLPSNVAKALISAEKILDPGSGGTVIVHPKGEGVLELTTTGARTLQTAAQLQIGTRVLVVSSASSATVNSVSITDGGFLLFQVTVDSSGTRQWAVVASSNVEAYLERAVLMAIPYTDFRVFDAQTTVLPVYADDDSDDIQIGEATIGTSAPTFAIGVTNATVTKNAVVNVVIPNDYVAGTTLSVVIPWTRSDAATTSSDLDLVAYRHAAPTVDICATAAQSINGAASGTATFALTSTALVPGETVLLHFTVAVVDGTTSRQDLTSVNLSYTNSVN